MKLTILSNKEQQTEAIKQIVARAAEMRAIGLGKLSADSSAFQRQRDAMDWMFKTT